VLPSGPSLGAAPASATVLDADLLRRWLDVATDGLLQSRSAIDLLNVYPVPDGDTGTNLHLTLARARAEVGQVPREGQTVGQVARSAARGALLGARGNSGVILSQLLHGWADALSGVRAAGPEHVVDAFRRADEQAWVAVESPAEGTILSVCRAASRAAAAAGAPPDADLAGVVSAAAAAARSALRRTTGQLDVLARAGVVDAGAAGLVLVLEALAAEVTGRRPAPATWGGRPHRDPGRPPASDGAFEVMYLLDAPEEAVAALRTRLATLGRSIAVVGGQGQWHVHAHSDRPEAVVAAGAEVGRTHAATVSRIVPVAAQDAGEVGDSHEQVGVVAWVSGPGLARAFAEAGAATVTASPGRLLEAGDLLAAARSTGRRSVIVLPNDPDVLLTAHVAASSAPDGLRLHVVTTQAEVQGLAAVAVHDAGAALEAAADAMAAAARHTRYGAVRVVDTLRPSGPGGPPVRTAPVAPVHAETLGMVDGQVVAVGVGVEAVALEVLERLLAAGGELVTLAVGAGVARTVADGVVRAARQRRPHLQAVVIDGGQPEPALLVGVE
jgi:hypothetical protein